MKKLLSVAAAASVAAVGFAPAPALAQEAFIGEIRYFAGNFAPRGWAFCDGQILQISQHTALFSILGTTYGGDGRSTFALPDARGRMMVHEGQGPGLSNRRLGQRAGSERHTLNQAQLPAHTHAATADASTERPRASAANTEVKLAPKGAMSSGAAPKVAVDVATTGGSQPVDHMPPYVTTNCIIAMVGIYPSRS